MKRAGLALLILAAAVTALSFAVASQAERHFNRVLPGGAEQVSSAARSLHEQLQIADLHADSLLWGRDLLTRGARGHVDHPRLVEGGVAIQVFSVVTNAARPARRGAGRPDLVGALAVAERWPPGTWRSLSARALYQAARLRETADRSDGRLVLLRTREDLEGLLEHRRARRDVVGALLALEGAQALEGRPEGARELFDAGFRMISVTHFADNEMGGSSSGVRRGGLSARGRRLVEEMESLKMIVDVSHSSSETIRDVLALSHRPVVASHTGVRATCDSSRNLSDREIAAIAAGGGIIGVGYWEGATCGHDAMAVARAVRHALEVAGAGHVGLGSDFDGAVTMPFDAAGLPRLTDALLRAGLSESQIRAVAGENVIRLLREALPSAAK